MSTRTAALALAPALLLGCAGGPYLDRCRQSCDEQRLCVEATTIVSCEQICRSQLERAERTDCVEEAESVHGCFGGLSNVCSSADCNDEVSASIACREAGAAADPCLRWCAAADAAGCSVDGGLGCAQACELLDPGARALSCHAEWAALVECEGAASDVCAPTECEDQDAAWEACLDAFCAELPAFEQPGLIDCPARG